MSRQRSQSRFLDLVILIERFADPGLVLLAGLTAYIIRFGFEEFPIPLFYLGFMLVTNYEIRLSNRKAASTELNMHVTIVFYRAADKS